MKNFLSPTLKKIEQNFPCTQHFSRFSRPSLYPLDIEIATGTSHSACITEPLDPAVPHPKTLDTQSFHLLELFHCPALPFLILFLIFVCPMLSLCGTCLLAPVFLDLCYLPISLKCCSKSTQVEFWG